MGMVVAVNLKDLFEEDVEEREVALFTAWMLVRAKNPDEVKARIYRLDEEANIQTRAFRAMVDQYAHFMSPIVGGKPRFVLFEQTDNAFSEKKQWRSMATLGFDFKPPDED